MRLRNLSVLMLVALALAACASPRARYAAPPAASYSELDARMYGAPQRSAYVTQPQSYVVRRATQVVHEVIDEGPYTLDTGDKLRIVVFGQDALSNTYVVNAEGQVSFPLVGNVTARGMTTEQLAGAVTSRLKQSYLRDPSVAVRSRSTGRSSCSARSPIPGNIRSCRT